MAEIPEKNLGLAIIKRAVNDALGNIKINYSTDGRNVQREALAWLFVIPKDDSEYRPEPFSFEWWCNVLEIEPEDTRAFVRTYKKQGVGAANISQCIVDDIYDTEALAVPFGNRPAPKYRYG